jgi:hypothetical protein
MTTYTAGRRDSVRVPWGLFFGLLGLVAGIVLFGVLVFAPWTARRDARDSLHAQQRLAVLHQLGFVHVAGGDFYGSSYYNSPTAFKYHVGSPTTGCNIEIVLAGSGMHTQPYIVLNGVADSTINVTYQNLKHIPQTRACFGG